MNKPHSLRRQIDAARPGSDDLRLPELSELALAVEADGEVARELEASHARDILFCDALHEVPVPSGLADRLIELTSKRPLAQVTAAAATAPDSAEQTCERWEAAKDAAEPVSNRRLARRVFVAVASLAAMALVAVSINSWRQAQPRSISEDQLVAMVESWNQQAMSPQGWTSPVRPALLSEYPVDPVVRYPSPTAVRTVPIAGRSSGVAYELTRPNKQRAVLFVVRTSDRFSAVSTVAYTKIRATGGKRVGAWQKNGYLYVLAVDDGQRIEDFLRKMDFT